MEILPSTLHNSFVQYNCAIVTTHMKLLLSTLHQTQINRDFRNNDCRLRNSHITRNLEAMDTDKCTKLSSWPLSDLIKKRAAYKSKRTKCSPPSKYVAGTELGPVPPTNCKMLSRGLEFPLACRSEHSHLHSWDVSFFHYQKAISIRK